MIELHDEFEARTARQKGRRLLPASDVRQWPVEEWVLWLEDGLNSFFSAKNDYDRCTSFQPFRLTSRDRIDASVLAHELKRVVRDHETARTNLGQALVDVCETTKCLGGGGITEAIKAEFVLEVCKDVVPERSIDVLEQILKLHGEGWIDITHSPNLVSMVVYVLQDHKNDPKVPALAVALGPLIDREDTELLKEFYKIPVVRNSGLGLGTT